MSKIILSSNDKNERFHQFLWNDNKNYKEIQTINEDYIGLIGLEDWQSIQETLLLEQMGVLDQVRKRSKDNSDFTNIDEIDWDSLEWIRMKHSLELC